MRIISGSARGRRLQTPAGEGTRPMLDRQKESLFNLLRECFPCGGVLDLFAGSGALGLEALSRGAERATFVERHPRALAALRANLRACGFEDRATVLPISAFGLEPARLGHPVGVLFLDPPFPLYRRESNRLHALTAALASQAPMERRGVLVVRAPTGVLIPAWPPPLVEHGRRRMGESVIILLHSNIEPGQPEREEAHPRVQGTDPSDR